MAAIDIRNVDIVFGAAPERALPLIDQGVGRAEILQRTGQIARCHRRLAEHRAGRDLRADGPVGLRQVDAAARRSTG